MKQQLPKEFQIITDKGDKQFYCVWFIGNERHSAPVKDWHEATAFCNRAAKRNIAAFAHGIIPGSGENRRCIFACSFKRQFAKHYNDDYVRLTTYSLAYELHEKDKES